MRTNLLLRLDYCMSSYSKVSHLLISKLTMIQNNYSTFAQLCTTTMSKQTINYYKLSTASHRMLDMAFYTAQFAFIEIIIYTQYTFIHSLTLYR